MAFVLRLTDPYFSAPGMFDRPGKALFVVARVRVQNFTEPWRFWALYFEVETRVVVALHLARLVAIAEHDRVGAGIDAGAVFDVDEGGGWRRSMCRHMCCSNVGET